MRYPLTLTNLGSRIAVVIGGGIVGERKVRSLLAADVQVRLISPSATGAINSLGRRRQDRVDAKALQGW